MARSRLRGCLTSLFIGTLPIDSRRLAFGRRLLQELTAVSAICLLWACYLVFKDRTACRGCFLVLRSASPSVAAHRAARAAFSTAEPVRLSSNQCCFVFPTRFAPKFACALFFVEGARNLLRFRRRCQLAASTRFSSLPSVVARATSSAQREAASTTAAFRVNSASSTFYFLCPCVVRSLRRQCDFAFPSVGARLLASRPPECQPPSSTLFFPGPAICRLRDFRSFRGTRLLPSPSPGSTSVGGKTSSSLAACGLELSSVVGQGLLPGLSYILNRRAPSHGQ